MNQTYSPREITQNTTEEWTFYSDDYPASDGFTATFILMNQSGSVTITASTNADGNAYDFALTKAQTAALFPGGYKYQCSVDDGTERYILEDGYCMVLPDLATTQVKDVDGRSSARQRHDAYIARLTNEAYIKTMGPDQIAAFEEMVRRLEWDLKREEEREKTKRAENSSRKMYVRFK